MTAKNEQSISQRPRLVVLCGPTASGKTGLALDLAGHFPLEVISADSRQVYRGMDIGTAKPTPAEQARVPHHLLDVVDPDEEFSASDYRDRARRAVLAVAGRGRLPLVVGGTGLYIRALTAGLIQAPGPAPELRRELRELESREGAGTLFRRLETIDPVSARHIHPRNLVRIMRALEVWELTGRPMSVWQDEHAFGEAPYRTLKFGLAVDPAELEARISRRVDAMLAQDLVAEVDSLRQGGGERRRKLLQTIGYREVVDYLDGRCSRAEMRENIILHTRQYAKRQFTWFRKDKSIIWVDSSRESARILSLIDDFMTH
jgi:tRNA dimethylallyltransferase